MDSLTVEFLYTHFHYSEEAPDREDGWLPGVAGTYVHQGPNRLYLRFRGEYSSGSVTYSEDVPAKTSQGSIIRPFSDFSDATIWSVEANVGWTWTVPQAPSLWVTPFLGIGYRQWERTTAPNLQLGNEELYRWIFLTGGLRLDYAFALRFRFAPEAAGKIPVIVNEMQHSQTSSIQGQTFDLHSQPGFIVRLPLFYDWTDRWSFMTSFVWEQIYIGGSKRNFYHVPSTGALADAYEPNSRTETLGMTFGVQYRF
ncbi:MAG: hypothetical protein AB1411_07420 [Nitrospirota bacterium]